MRLRSFARFCVLCGLLGCTGESATPAESAAPATAPESAPKAAADNTPPSAPVATVSPAAELGKPAPNFTLTDTDGKTHTLESLRGKTVVLEWFNPDCPFVKFAHGKGPLVDLAKRSMGDDLVWLSVNSGAPGKQGHGLERNKAGKAEYAMVNPVLLDETGTVGRAYGAIKTPHLFVIDPAGVLVYRGGLDNAPMGVVDAERPRLEGTPAGELVNYLDAAIEDLRKKAALRLSDTPAYGCSVKYES